VEAVIVVVTRVGESGLDRETGPVARLVGLAVDDPSAERRLVAGEPASVVVGVGHYPWVLLPVV